LEFFRRAVTVIGPALREHLARNLGMARGAGELMDDVTIPVEPEPGEPIDDRGHRVGGRAHPVRILDAQPECAALAITLVVARIEPVEQCGAGAADMEKPGRGGGETDDDTHGALCKPCWRAAKSLSRTAGEGARGRSPKAGEGCRKTLTQLAALATLSRVALAFPPLFGMFWNGSHNGSHNRPGFSMAQKTGRGGPVSRNLSRA